MPSGQAPSARPSGTDSLALLRFKREYEAARHAPRPVFDKYLPILGATRLLDFLEATYTTCHAQSHDLGKALFAASNDLGTALRTCGARCTSGCMHGAVSEAFGRVSVGTIAAKMNKFCAEGEMARLHPPGNCAHGIGHALMFVTHGDVKSSIEACLGFTVAPMGYYCGTGVYMEKFLTARAEGAPSSSAYAPCDQEALFPAACYRYKGAERLRALGNQKLIKLECSRLTGLQRRGCFHGLGYASIDMVSHDPGTIGPMCGGGSRDDEVVCIEGVIEKLADVDPGRASAACASLGGEMRAVCDQGARRKMYSLDKPTFGLYYDKGAITARRAATAESLNETENHHREHGR